MNKNSKKIKPPDRVEALIQFFKTLKNPMKKGDLSEMLLKDDFHNKDMTEEEYQTEQKEWLNKVKQGKEK